MNWHDVLERAGWTFVQGFASSALVVGPLPLVTDVGAWEVFAVAGLTGGLASVFSFLKTVAQERLAKTDTRSTAVSPVFVDEKLTGFEYDNEH